MGLPARKRVSEPILRPMLPEKSPSHTTSSSPSSSSSSRARTLSADEEGLARRIETNWQFVGARSLMARYGFDEVSRLVGLVQAAFDRGANVEDPARLLAYFAKHEGVPL